CAEHGVLEAVCTKCNPKLAAIFKAKGDWCAEHGFPESFCPTCHPERGGRPAADMAADDAPPNGTKVQFRSREAVTAADIASQPALAVTEAGTLDVLATIAYDVTRHVAINPPLPGVVRALLVAEGASVAKDAALATIDSAEVAAELSRLVSARSRLQFGEAARTRARSLLDTGMGTKRDLLEAEREIAEANADIAAATGALGLVGIEGGASSAYTLRAPIAGTVLHLAGAAGRMVGTGDVLCELVDPSSMWAELEIPEAELGRVAKELDVVVTAEALPGREFRGRIDTILPEVDPRTRTVKARVRLANPDGVLRAHMYVRARIVLPRSSARALVPLDALQRAGTAQLVFVRLAPDRYELRRVQVGARRGTLVEILHGVQPGEPVATRGSFLLKTETLKGSIGAGCCDVEP
ncbi:MAG TPA: efflux RND transporter periplasmic adaptor subunit, partial [Planctomycetota bacterium]|nr:efflux RND transporter periplasmic adaptor subunit [Planctomycetota bacterium]